MVAEPPQRPAELTVLYNGTPVATVRDLGNLAVELQFRPEIVETAAGQPVVSVRLPVRAEPYPTEQTHPFLDGLLPEGDTRRRLITRHRLADDDVFGLLAEIGRDCAGALSFVPAIEGGAPIDNAASIRWLNEDELRRLIDELPVRPLGDDPDEGVRLSLAGAQDKAPVVIDDQARVGLPQGSMASTHILKAPSTQRTRSGRPRLPGLVENEAFCMRLALNLGLDAAAVRVRQVAGEPVLVVGRFDRQRLEDGSIRRIHQEDVCQALGMAPHRKYEEHGGPGAASVIGVVRSFSAQAARDVLEFIDRMAFDFVIGNLDAHGKNTSLLHDDAGIVLSPMYDVVCTLAYPHLDRRLAMAIGGQFQADQVTARHWAQLLGEVGLDTAALRRRLVDLATRTLELFAPTRDQASAEGFDHPVIDAIENEARGKARVLASLPDWKGRQHR